MTKKEYVERIMYLCSLCFQKPTDYVKKNVKRHNKAVRELIAIDNALACDIQMSQEVYQELLKIEDPYIKQRSAVACLRLNIHIDQAVYVLERIVKYGKPWEAMGAERQLKLWRGEIDPNEPD